MRVAVATDDGVKVSSRFGRADAFVVADVGLGMIVECETRRNPAGSRTQEPAGRKRRVPVRDRHLLVADALSDCRVVIASSLGEKMRQTLNGQGVEVVITSEHLVDRALALFTLAALRDESQFDPDELDGFEAIDEMDGDSRDDFDG